MLLDRRLFLKTLGIVGGSTMVSCDVMAPKEKLAAYLTPPVEMIPGRAAYYATVCRACPAGCGILVKTREGRPIKLEGNPAHPVNQGKLCMRGQAFVQDLYSRNRVQKPLVVNGGAKKETEWRTAVEIVSKRLKAARSVGFLTGLESRTVDSLLIDFADGFDSFKHVVHEPGGLAALADASERVLGAREVPRIDFSSTDYVVSLGADFLDAWISPVELTREWSERHTAARGRALQMAYVGPHRNLTATAADEWHTLRGSAMGGLAVAVLKGVFEKKQRKVDTATRGLVSTAIQKLTRGAKDTGPVPATLVKRLVDRLVSAESGLVLFGGAGVVGPHAGVIHSVVLLTNQLLGAVGRGLHYGEGSSLSRIAPDKAALELLTGAAKGAPEVLFVMGTNPAYTLPGGADLIKKAKMVVALSHSHDETSDLADVVLPIHHPLESWGDFDVTDNIAGLMQPVRAPLYDTQHVGDLLLLLRDLAGKGKKLEHSSYKGYLTAKWAAWLHPVEIPAAPEPVAADGGVPEPSGDTPADSTKTVQAVPPAPADPADAGPPPPPAPPPEPPKMETAEWEEMLVLGGYYRRAKTGPAPVVQQTAASHLIKRPFAETKDLELIVPFSVTRYDGRGATLDWLRETPEPLLQTAWEIPLEIARETAAKQGIETGDRVRLACYGGEVPVRAVVTDELAPGTVALPPGGGRSHARFQRDTANPFALLPAAFDPHSGVLSLSVDSVTIKKEDKGAITSVMGSPDSKGRLLALDVGLAAYQKGELPKLTRHGQVMPGDKHYEDAHAVPMPHQEKPGTRPDDNMYSLQAHDKHRWGLVVDLDKCTGCSACVVSCYAENNIPVVGQKEVAKGRELSWIRIEKHVFTGKDGEQVRFLPVMCQQCDNAPCETVCPVFASSHTTDGLNAQIYNRCVGTRYCANNCPYKVRRFNFFDYERETPGNQQLNPDVTVRSRGVMEKCTFCIQRIREAQNRAKLEKQPLKDGDIVPACVQTCPAGALSFGDFSKAEWQMTKLARDPRGYRLLDYSINTRPGVVYLRKVTTEKG